MGILHKVVGGPHVGKVLIKPISHKSPAANHSAMHIPPSPKPVAPIKQAVKSSGAPGGFKPTIGVVGSGKHSSPYSRVSVPAATYNGTHRKNPMDRAPGRIQGKHRSGY